MAALKLHPVELFIKDEDMPFTFDSSLGTIRMPDGSIRFLQTDNCEPPYYLMYRGTPENPVEKLEMIFNVEYNGFAHTWPSAVWVMGIVEHKGVWVGVCHREHFLHYGEEDLTNPARRVFNFHIGLAISEDAGEHWSYIGDVCSNVLNNKGIEPNMGGVPTLKVGNWLQFFFNDYKRDGSRHISAARIDLDQCVDCLKAGKLPRALKYTREDEFNTDGLLGVGSMIIPDSDKPGRDAHACAAYCAPLGKYLVTVQTHGEGKLLMYTSDDAIHFDPEPIVVHDAGPGNHMQPYSTFVAISTDDSTDDMTTIGREFYIYWTLKGMGQDYAIDNWYRRKFTVED